MEDVSGLTAYLLDQNVYIGFYGPDAQPFGEVSESTAEPLNST